jgi:predicted flap endonuclease-1-like 5' DNA nuclease
MGKVLGALAGILFAGAAVFLLVWVLWLLWKRQEEMAKSAPTEIEVPVPPPAVEPTAKAEAVEPPAAEEEVEEPAQPVAPDDLKRIEGIGPKFSSVLQEAGITTFAQLAETEADQIRAILEAADPRLLRLADPTTWPEQASLAASGQWEALEAFQAELQGGRRA